jgi:hypothetical protein
MAYQKNANLENMIANDYFNQAVCAPTIRIPLRVVPSAAAMQFDPNRCEMGTKRHEGYKCTSEI